jgi:hypothetical protein
VIREARDRALARIISQLRVSLMGAMEQADTSDHANVEELAALQPIDTFVFDIRKVTMTALVSVGNRANRNVIWDKIQVKVAAPVFPEHPKILILREQAMLRIVIYFTIRSS